ncbi:MAG: hypothetical protein EXR71_20765 [Myxococcales bacterium]|nr:hypothetical protein [Myxococcales bacterium]
MSFELVPTTKHRQVVNDLLDRARIHHASVNATAEYDVTDLRVRLRAARRGGAAASLTSYLVKATASLLREQPDLNQHLFVSWWGRRRVVRFEDIHCTLIVARRHEGQDLLFPLVVRHADRLSIGEIEAIVHHHKTAPLAELEQMQALERVKRTPRIGLKLFSLRARSDPAFYLRTFGTYGLSSLVRQRGHGIAGATVANTGVAFLPGSLRALPRVVDGQIVARDVLSVGFVFDHYLLDGVAMVRAVEGLARYLERPAPWEST